MSKNAQLVKYDAMCRAIDQAHAVDEVKDIRDKALAFETYARQAKNINAEIKAVEIRIRAERKAGTLSKRLSKKPGARTDKEPSRIMQRGSKREQLRAAGITKDQAHRWEKLADVPDGLFERGIAGANGRPTTHGIIASSKKSKPNPVAPDALWMWGRLRDFNGRGILANDPVDIMKTMTDDMKDDVHRWAPKVAAWLKRIGATK